MIADVTQDMAKPLEFRKKKKGMQAGNPFGPFGQWACTKLWRAAGHLACASAWLMEKLGVHKQYANRLIEPFAHITVVVTATEWANFFALRNHPAAQPEIKALAQCMLELWLHNEPLPLKDGMWHLPFVDDNEMLEASYYNPDQMTTLIKRSVACCARTSYLNHDKTMPDDSANLKLHDQLVAEDPKHASPAEHQATPMYSAATPDTWSGNFRGWKQYRKTIEGENVNVYSEVPDYLKPRNPFEYYMPGNLVGHTVSRR
jgi:hypothetical protein